MIQFRQCTVALGDRFRLGPLNWVIEPGQCWVVIGANGSGKSALAATLQGEGLIIDGEADLSASRVAAVSLEEQSRLIQREIERDDSDITDTVNHGTPVAEMLAETSQDPVLLDELIDIFGVRHLLDRGFRKLSTGETRKVLFIRAVTAGPDLLVLDEPFEGLDVDTVPKVEALLARLALQTTLVLVLNRADEIPDYTTHVVRMDTGAMVQNFSCENVAALREIVRQAAGMRSTDLALPPPEETADTRLNDDGSLISLKAGRVAYTDNVVFQDLDWEIRPGEHWQVKGPNGSGKTCLLNLITGDHPQCYVNDLTLFGIRRGQGESIWDIKRHLGFVSTGLHWDYRLSVSARRVIISGFYDSIGLYQRATEKEEEIAQNWLDLLGLTNKGNAAFSSLSYGEQRVLLIARAMVKHPPVLLLDEPCLGLDEANRILVLSLIERICEEGATTLIYVSHHLEDSITAIRNELDLGAREAA